jgi:DNA polymerase III delta subunit
VIYIIHGENQIASRKEALKVAKEKGAQVIEIRSIESSPSEIASKFFSTDLFGGSLSFIFNITKDKNFDYKELIERLKATGIEKSRNTLIFYSTSTIEKSNPVLKNSPDLKATLLEFKEAEKQNIFGFIDTLMDKQRKPAYNKLGELLEGQEDEFEIMSMVSFGLRNLAFFHFSSPSFSKLHPFVQQKTTKQAKNFTKEQIASLYENLYQYDLEVKTGVKNPDMVLSLIVEKFIS